jgi:hypothetical protein
MPYAGWSESPVSRALESREGEFLCTDAHRLRIPAQTVREARHQQSNGREAEEVPVIAVRSNAQAVELTAIGVS